MTLPTPPQNALTRRTRTPPDLKWLLNERAALAGAVETSVVRQGLLTARLQRAERQCTELAATLAGSERALGRNRATIDALDATIRMAYAEVESSAGGVVKAWAGKYGKRGGLQAFLVKVMKFPAPEGRSIRGSGPEITFAPEGRGIRPRSQRLKEAAPLPVDTLHLLLAVVAHFGISVADPYDRRALQRTLRGALRQICRKGLIEPLHNRTKSNSPGVWCWKQPDTLADLAVRAAAIAKAAADEASHPNARSPGPADTHPS